MSHIDQTKISSLSNSTARALRTAYQTVIGFIGLVPTLIAVAALIPQDTPVYAQLSVVMGGVVLWSGIASKILNVLEDNGIIPAPWKQQTQVAVSTPAPEAPAAPTAVTPPVPGTGVDNGI